MGMLAGRLDEVAGTVSAAVTATGTHLLAFTQCGAFTSDAQCDGRLFLGDGPLL